MGQITWEQREQFIADFEAARGRDPQADPADFLPPPDHPLRRQVLRELLRIDLEQRRPGQPPRSVESYLERFPELADDREGLAEVAFEDYRQRCLLGEAVQPEEYERRLGIAVDSWPRLHLRVEQAIASAERGTNLIHPSQQASLDRLD